MQTAHASLFFLALVLIIGALAACSVVGDFVNDSPARQTLTVREVTAQAANGTEIAPTLPAPPTRMPGPTPTPTTCDGSLECAYVQGVYDYCRSVMVSAFSDYWIQRAASAQADPQELVNAFCNYDAARAYAGGWHNSGSTGFVWPPAPVEP